jgi:DNA-binding XRE family transcriptional regulator
MSEVINETINDRFRKVKDYFKLSVNKFAKMIGVSQPSAKAIIDGSNEPSNKAINGLAKGFPTISMDWLIKGIGSMFNECPCNKDSDPNEPFMLGEPEPTRPEPNLRNHINFLEQQLKLEQQKNELLQQQLNLYENRV